MAVFVPDTFNDLSELFDKRIRSSGFRISAMIFSSVRRSCAGRTTSKDFFLR